MMQLELLTSMKYVKKQIRDNSMIVQNACVTLGWNDHSNKLRGLEDNNMMIHLSSVLNTLILTTLSLWTYWSY